MKTYAIIAAAGLQALALNAPVPDEAGLKMVMLEGITGKAVTGHPFSATEQRHTVQTLGDGTKIENTDTDKYFRDEQGRTRVERSNGAVMVHDPVLGISAETNNSNKVVRRGNVAYSTATAPNSDKAAAELKAVSVGVGGGAGMGIGRGMTL